MENLNTINQGIAGVSTPGQPGAQTAADRPFLAFFGHHKRHFKSLYGDLAPRLGYEKDNDW